MSPFGLFGALQKFEKMNFEIQAPVEAEPTPEIRYENVRIPESKVLNSK